MGETYKDFYDVTVSEHNSVDYKGLSESRNV